VIEHLFDTVASMALAQVPDGVVTASAALLARERTLPVDPVLAPLFGPGLARGQTVVCTGSASVSSALALLVAPTRHGSWAGVVGVPTFGVVAAADMGVVLERTVFVDGPLDAHGDPANVLGALVDGVDLVVTSSSFLASLPPSLVRRFTTRLQSRGAVCVVVDETRAIPGDVRVATRVREWSGIGDGHGHVRARRVTVSVDGRRQARALQRDVWLPGPSGRLEEIVSSGEIAPARLRVVP
jgi:hypothetical protein